MALGGTQTSHAIPGWIVKFSLVFYKSGNTVPSLGASMRLNAGLGLCLHITGLGQRPLDMLVPSLFPIPGLEQGRCWLCQRVSCGDPLQDSGSCQKDVQ